MGNDLPQFLGTTVVAALYILSDNSARRSDHLHLYGSFWFDCSFFTACPRVVTLTTLQTAGVFVCAHDYSAVRAVQATLQTATAVFCSRELVSCGNGGILFCS